jgi:hypothetical protein
MEDILGSKMPADNRYGQNGAPNSSSDLPGQPTTSGVLPQTVLPVDDWQTRGVGTLGKGSKPAVAFGHRSRNGE